MESALAQMKADSHSLGALKAEVETVRAKQVGAAQWEELKAKVTGLTALESKVKGLGELRTDFEQLNKEVSAIAVKVESAKPADSHKAVDAGVGSAEMDACTSRLARLERMLGPDSGDGTVHQTLTSLRSRVGDIVTSQSQLQSQLRQVSKGLAQLKIKQTQADFSKSRGGSVAQADPTSPRAKGHKGSSGALEAAAAAPTVDKLVGIEARLERLEEELAEANTVAGRNALTHVSS